MPPQKPVNGIVRWSTLIPVLLALVGLLGTADAFAINQHAKHTHNGAATKVELDAHMAAIKTDIAEIKTDIRQIQDFLLNGDGHP